MFQEQMIFNAILSISQREQSINNTLSTEDALKLATKLVDDMLNDAKSLANKHFPTNP